MPTPKPIRTLAFMATVGALTLSGAATATANSGLAAPQPSSKNGPSTPSQKPTRAATFTISPRIVAPGGPIVLAGSCPEGTHHFDVYEHIVETDEDLYIGGDYLAADELQSWKRQGSATIDGDQAKPLSAGKHRLQLECVAVNNALLDEVGFVLTVDPKAAPSSTKPTATQTSSAPTGKATASPTSAAPVPTSSATTSAGSPTTTTVTAPTTTTTTTKTATTTVAPAPSSTTTTTSPTHNPGPAPATTTTTTTTTAPAENPAPASSTTTTTTNPPVDLPPAGATPPPAPHVPGSEPTPGSASPTVSATADMPTPNAQLKPLKSSAHMGVSKKRHSRGGAKSRLAHTGADVAPLLGGGAALVLGGSALLALARMRRRKSNS